MYSSAGSNQENNHFSPDSKSTWLSCFFISFFFPGWWTFLLFVSWTVRSVRGSVVPVRPDRKPLDSPGHAHAETNPSPGGLKAGPPEFIHYTRRASPPALDVTPPPKAGLLHFFWMIPWLFYDILDINIAGIPHIPSPCLYVFAQPPSKALVRSPNLGYTCAPCLFLPPSWTAGIFNDPLWLRARACLRVRTACGRLST